jgi:hypothetical protein
LRAINSLAPPRPGGKVRLPPSRRSANFDINSQKKIDSMRYACLALFAAALAAGSAHAAPGLVDRWRSDAIVEALRSLGATDIQTSQGSAQPSIIARTADGLSLGLFARACRPSPFDQTVDDCPGLEGLISYDVSRRADRAALAERLNHRFAAGKFTLEAGGALRLSRYVGLEGGVTPENLRDELRDFFAVGAMTAQTLWPPAASPAAQPPLDQPLSPATNRP